MSGLLRPADSKWHSNLHIYKKFDKFTSKYMFNISFATFNPVSEYKKRIRNRFRTVPSRWHNTIEYRNHPPVESGICLYFHKRVDGTIDKSVPSIFFRRIYEGTDVFMKGEKNSWNFFLKKLKVRCFSKTKEIPGMSHLKSEQIPGIFERQIRT